MNIIVLNFFIVLSGLILITVQNSVPVEDDYCDNRFLTVSDNCCLMPNIYTDMVKAKCQDISRSSNADEQLFKVDIAEAYSCFTSCALNETGILDNVKLNEENMMSYLSDALEDIPDMIPILKEAFETCFKVNEFTIQNAIQPPAGYCSYTESFIMNCVFLNTFMNCYKGSAWTNTDECNAEHVYWQRCLNKENYS